MLLELPNRFVRRPVEKQNQFQLENSSSILYHPQASEFQDMSKRSPRWPTASTWVRATTRPRLSGRHTKPLRVVDLFCGCGGLTLGAWEAARRLGRRLTVPFAIDSAKAPIDVFRANFGSITETLLCDDILNYFLTDLDRPFTTTELFWREKLPNIELLVAGPPCQGHSDLNNSTRRRDPRNKLYLAVARAARLLRPSAIIIENVPAVVHDRNGVVETACASLERLGYHVEGRLVNLLAFGVPQRRRRHLLLATATKIIDLDDFVQRENGTVPTVCDFIGGLEDEPNTRQGAFYTACTMSGDNMKRVAYLFKHNVYDLPDRLRPTCHRDKPHTYQAMYGRMKWDQPAPTITSGFGSMGQGRFVHPTRARMLTPHEAARLQGFPDFYDFSTVDRLTALREMIGNAVPPQLVATLVEQMLTKGVL